MLFRSSVAVLHAHSPYTSPAYILQDSEDKEAVKVERELTKNRNNLIAAARNGDEEAMEDLTMEDMDMYSMISERIVTDDVLKLWIPVLCLMELNVTSIV